MSNEKFTPFPWKRNKDGELCGPDGKIIRAWDLGIAFGRRTLESEGNAALFRSAPEMYEALRALVEMCDDPNPLPPHGQSLAGELVRLLPAARAALAKAEGRQ